MYRPAYPIDCWHRSRKTACHMKGHKDQFALEYEASMKTFDTEKFVAIGKFYCVMLSL